MKRSTWLDAAVVVGGVCSPVGLLGIFLATHDIFHDYASPTLWARVGERLPEWYSPLSATPLEWGFVQVGLVMVLGFHAALFARLVTRLHSGTLGTPIVPSLATVMGSLSFLGFVAFLLAAHDVYNDYASPDVWARAGRPLPAWYSPVNQTPGEWHAMQVGFLLILAFHVLLAVRRTRRPAMSRGSLTTVHGLAGEHAVAPDGRGRRGGRAAGGPQPL